ncbi:histidine kinase [Aquimarina sp. ERC-38]|uniref:sensor histidine kinase n=1 Tax=Aquimarina sp. ERC-38 TaxID=2949996 RepID=UPI0022487374|nr:histidine kinase [Aquimarina sp. ERC-38]UZO81280.1 histidine kinase [Aquimarina sp. ERC-38]
MNTKINSTDYILLGAYFMVSALIQFFTYYDANSLIKEYLLDIPIDIITALIFIFLFMGWLIPNFIVRKKQYFKFIIFGLVIMLVLGFIDYTVNFYSGENDWNIYPSFWKLCRISITVMAEESSLPLGLLLGKKYYEGQLQYSEIKREQKEHELKLLRSQIDPHFLFNNLNTLDALIDSDPKKAKEYINRLSLIYRYLIQTKEAEVMELSKEVQFAENYIFLIQTRFYEDYNFEIIENKKNLNKYIPTSALQSLLENIVKHNKASHHQKIESKIIIDEEWLTVTNTKSDINNMKETLGTGLENLKRRYELLSDQNIIIKDHPNEFIITIPILKLSA